jgi:GNAT superfamily N-acetyltransferase
MASWLMGDIFSWESQAAQYAFRSEPGIHLERHHVGELGNQTVIDCLLSRDEMGMLIGILNHYADNNSELEQEGNINIWVKPDHQRQGVGTALIAEAVRRWGIDFNQQRYTNEGFALIQSFIGRFGRSGDGL